jgi:DNA-binding response OmpR family regulator
MWQEWALARGQKRHQFGVVVVIFGEQSRVISRERRSKEVATALNVSPYTVETHRTHIMQKLDLHNTAEVVLYAVRKKIIS